MKGFRFCYTLLYSGQEMSGDLQRKSENIIMQMCVVTRTGITHILPTIHNPEPHD